MPGAADRMIAGVILAGDRGRRPGAPDKGLIEPAGSTLVERIAAWLSPPVGELLTGANRNPARPLAGKRRAASHGAFAHDGRCAHRVYAVPQRHCAVALWNCLRQGQFRDEAGLRGSPAVAVDCPDALFSINVQEELELCNIDAMAMPYPRNCGSIGMPGIDGPSLQHTVVARAGNHG